MHVTCKDCGAWIVDDATAPRIKVFMRLHYWVAIDHRRTGPRDESDNAAWCNP